MAERPQYGKTDFQMIHYPAITNRLPFRIIAPAILLMLLAGSGLYMFFHYVASDFVTRIIKNNLDERAADIYTIADKSLDELIQGGLSGDEKAVRIKKALTLSLVEDTMRENDLKGTVTEDGKTALVVDGLSPEILKMKPGGIKDNVASLVRYQGSGYYLYLLEFEPWKWHIYLIKSEAEYSALINKVRLAYALAGIVLLLASFLFIYYLEWTIEAPLAGIIGLLKRGEKPGYRGIHEFELLSDNIGAILQSLQHETEKLNSIYYIARSKRGKDFFDEVAVAIARMFDLNTFIAKVNPGGETLHIISQYANGELTGNTERPLDGTPCADVMTNRQLVVIESGVCRRFPSPLLEAPDPAESYACVPIFDRKGDIIGMVNVFGKQRTFTDADIKVLQTIGQMAAAEFEMLEKTVFLDSILHASTDTAIVAADLDYRVTFYNPAAENIFGLKAEGVIGKKLAELKTMETVDTDRFEKGIENVKSKGHHQFSYKAKQDGEFRHIDARVYGMPDEQHKLAGFVLMARDISDYKRLEEQLLHSQKLEAVGLLAGGVAHEFNNILMGIMGYASLLKNKIGHGDPSQTYIDNILTSSKRAANLTQGLLAFSRKQNINPRPVNINNIVRRVEELLIRIIGEEIELRTLLAPADLTVTADSGQIEQVLMNLATNARDAMPHGGILTIETEPVTLSDEYPKDHLRSGREQYALISLSDTGVGMDEKTRERIFEPFFTSKEVGKGTGLGLSVVFGIIKQHNGNITVTSEPGRGTTFKIYLPLHNGPRTEEPQPALLRPPVRGTETLLLAEDNAQVRNLVKALLQDAGYTVITAAGEDALRVFEENRERIRMLILDVVMPKKSGKEVYNDIRKIRPDIKTLFMSGYTADVVRQRGTLEEEIDFISKPIFPDVLLRKVREILDR